MSCLLLVPNIYSTFWISWISKQLLQPSRCCAYYTLLQLSENLYSVPVNHYRLLHGILLFYSHSFAEPYSPVNNIFEYFQSYFSRYSSPKRNFLLICGLSTLCILRMMLGPSMLNPFFVIPFLICYVCMKHNKHISWMLRFWGRHSTNLWLVHTFFAYYLFHDFIYSFHYPILIYLVLLIISLGSSYVVRFIHHPIKSITNNLINCR